MSKSGVSAATCQHQRRAAAEKLQAGHAGRSNPRTLAGWRIYVRTNDDGALRACESGEASSVLCIPHPCRGISSVHPGYGIRRRVGTWKCEPVDPAKILMNIIIHVNMVIIL